MPLADSRSFPSSLIRWILGHGTGDAEVLRHPTTKAGDDSRGVNAGRISRRAVVCGSGGVALRATTAKTDFSRMSNSTPVWRKGR